MDRGLDVVALLRTLTVAFAALAAGAAHAHAAEPQAAPDPWAWNCAPWLVALLLLSAGLYLRGLRRLWRHAGAGRGIRAAEAAAFAAGWLALVAALVTPLDALGAQLFSAHMVQHELLMVVAAPLLVLGRPLATWTWALGPAQRRLAGGLTQARPWAAPWRVLTDPLVAWTLHAAALWGWHIPAAFDAALRHEGLHIAQHASFFVTALFFWWAVLGHDVRGRHGAGHACACLFTTMLHTSALGALLSLAPTAWYAPYLSQTAAFGFDPVEDQQLGGLIMWVPASLAYVIAGLAVLGKLLMAKLPQP